MKSLFDELADVLVDRVAERVVARLASSTTVYTSAPGGPHIPGKSRSWSLRNIRSMRGARKVGRDWVISAEAYEAWLAERDDARFHAGPPAANDVDRLVQEGLRAAGFRRTR